MSRSPKPIASALSELLARRGYARTQSAAHCDRAWRDAAGPLFADQTRAGHIRRGVMEVVVSNSTLLQELTFQKVAIVARLAAALPEENIADLRFRIGCID